MGARKQGRVYFANTQKIFEDFGNQNEICQSYGIKKGTWNSWLARNKPIMHLKSKKTHDAFMSLIQEGYLKIGEDSNV